MPQWLESTRVERIAHKYAVSGSFLKRMGCDFNADQPAGGEDLHTLVLNVRQRGLLSWRYDTNLIGS